MRFHILVVSLANLAACAPAATDPQPDASSSDVAMTDSNPQLEDVVDAAPDVADAQTAPPTYGAVAQLFGDHCGGYCHGGGTGADGTILDRAHLVNVAAVEVPSLSLVAPGDPTQSYLMMKLDGDYTTLPECEAQPDVCGLRMPRLDTPLSADDRDLVRQWISAGAPGPD